MNLKFVKKLNSKGDTCIISNHLKINRQHNRFLLHVNILISLTGKPSIRN